MHTISQLNAQSSKTNKNVGRNAAELFNSRFSSSADGTTSSQKTDSSSFAQQTSSTANIINASNSSSIQKNTTNEMLSEGRQSSLTHSMNSSLVTNHQANERTDLSRTKEKSNRRQFANQDQSHISTGVAMNTSVRDQALHLFGSPQEALSALSASTQTRISLARHMQTLAREEDGITDTIGNSAGATDIPQQLSKPTAQSLRTGFSADSSGIEASHTFSSEYIRGAVGHLTNSPQQTFMPISDSDREQFYLVKGLTAAASAQYQTDQTGMISVGSRSFLFGLGYSSPGDLYKSLLAKSHQDQEFREALIHLGKSVHSDPERTFDSKEIISMLSRK